MRTRNRYSSPRDKRKRPRWFYIWCAQNGIDVRVYKRWCEMRQRCNNPNGKDYPRYGGRGIRICKRWDEFKNFAEDMGPYPGRGWTVERMNNDGNYKPSNVHWGTYGDQARNTRRTKLTTKLVAYIRKKYRPVYGSGAALARELGVHDQTVMDVIHGRRWVNG